MDPWGTPPTRGEDDEDPADAPTDIGPETDDDIAEQYEAWLAEQDATAPLPASERRGGLQYVKRWALSLAGCREVTASEKVTAWAIREYVHAASGTVYVGLDKLARDTGIRKGALSERRTTLIEAGWLTPTSETRGRTKVYRLTDPGCPCGGHSMWVPGIAERSTDRRTFRDRGSEDSGDCGGRVL